MQLQTDVEGQACVDPLLVAGLIVGKTVTGRSIYSAAGKAAIVQLYQRGAGSIAQLSEANGINVNLITKWSRATVAPKKVKPTGAIRPAKLIAVGLTQPNLHSAQYAIQIELSHGTIRLTLPQLQEWGPIIEQLNGAR